MTLGHMTLTLDPRKNPRRKAVFLLRLSVAYFSALCVVVRKKVHIPSIIIHAICGYPGKSNKMRSFIWLQNNNFRICHYFPMNFTFPSNRAQGHFDALSIDLKLDVQIILFVACRHIPRSIQKKFPSERQSLDPASDLVAPRYAWCVHVSRRWCVREWSLFMATRGAKIWVHRLWGGQDLSATASRKTPSASSKAF